MRVSGELSSTTRPGTPERVPWACAKEHSWGRRAGRPSEHPRARGHLPQGSARSAGLEKTSVGNGAPGVSHYRVSMRCKWQGFPGKGN